MTDVTKPFREATEISNVEFKFAGAPVLLCPHCSGKIHNCPVCLGKKSIRFSEHRLVRFDDLKRLMETCDPIRHEDFDAYRRLEHAVGESVDPRASKWGSGNE